MQKMQSHPLAKFLFAEIDLIWVNSIYIWVKLKQNLGEFDWIWARSKCIPKNIRSPTAMDRMERKFRC